MTITLDPEIAERVNEKIASGEFSSPRDFVTAALCYYLSNEPEDPMPLDELREALAATENSTFTAYTAQTLKAHFEELKAEGRRRLAAQQNRA